LEPGVAFDFVRSLAARLLRIANSASLNRSGRPVSDLRQAINRIGYNMVRSASISFSMAQIRNSNKLAGLEHHLNELWQRSILVASFQPGSRQLD
jgi:HD-like signal output (HDOD) protein